MRDLINIVEGGNKQYTQDELAELFINPSLYHKVGLVKARLAKAGEIISTVLDGEVETTNTARPSDVIVCGARAMKSILSIRRSSCHVIRDRHWAQITNLTRRQAAHTLWNG